MQNLRELLNKSPWRWPLLAFLIALAVAAFLLGGPSHKARHPAPNVSFSQLEQLVARNKVRKLDWNPNTLAVTVTQTDKKIAPYTVGVPYLIGKSGLENLLGSASAHHVNVSSEAVPNPAANSLADTLLRYAPTVVILIVILVVMRQMGPLKKLKIDPAKSSVTFADVAGCGEAIQELQDVRSFLAEPQRYEKLGAKVPKGVLLYGAPGTGKTLLARAVAGEAGIPFFHISGSEFIEMFAGVGARRARQLFEQAKKVAPSIIFIDELDAVGGKRTGGGDGAAREGDQTLNQILTEMDGFEVGEHPVIVIGATNRLDTLDPAILRPGRFDRHIAIDPPDRHGRLDILNVHREGKPFDDDVNFVSMAAQSSGMSGAELALWLNEAALIAARRDAKSISRHDVENAFFRILAGPEKQHRVMSDEERATVAYHEAGHALVGELLEGAEHVHKISIIPRGQSGGQTVRVSDEDVFLHREGALHNDLAMLLAGRAAEEMIFGEVSSGAHDDLQRATGLAKKMFKELGMSRSLGLLVAADGSPLSDRFEAEVDGEIKQMLAGEYQRAQSVLAEHKAKLTLIAERLLVEETLDRDQFLALLNEQNASV